MYVRLPEDQRVSENDLSRILIKTPAGGEIPLSRAAHRTRGRSFTTINRTDGRRVISVTADVGTGTNANQAMDAMMDNELPTVLGQFAGLTYGLSGQQKEQAENMKALGQGFIAALLIIFAILAVAFRSYLQPVVVMTAIPFGFVGAIAGHMILGFNLSLMSIMGFVALAGVVVNDSIVLVHAANTFIANGMSVRKAAVAAGPAGFGR